MNKHLTITPVPINDQWLVNTKGGAKVCMYRDGVDFSKILKLLLSDNVLRTTRAANEKSTSKWGGHENERKMFENILILGMRSSHEAQRARSPNGLSKARLLDLYHHVDEKFQNYIPVSYRFGTECGNIGRVYPERGIGFCAMRKSLRSYLCKDRYLDVDMENCHPRMMDQIFEEKYPTLHGYVSNRDSYFDQLQEFYREKGWDTMDWRAHDKDRSNLKELFIRVLYFGNPMKWAEEVFGKKKWGVPKFVKDLQGELLEMVGIVKECNPWMVKLAEALAKEENPDGTIMSWFLQEHERRLLEHAVEFFEKRKMITKVKGARNVSLVFDGLQVLVPEEGEIDSGVLMNLSQYIVLKAGLHMTFKVKPFEDTSVEEALSALEIPELTHKDEYVESDRDAVDLLYPRLRDRMKPTQNGIYFKLKSNKWTMNTVSTQREILEYVNQSRLKRKRDSGEDELFTDSGRTAMMIRDLIMNRASLEDNWDPNFYETLHRSMYGRLCFQDGILDFQKKEFYEWGCQELKDNPAESAMMIRRNFKGVFENRDGEKWTEKKRILRETVLDPIFSRCDFDQIMLFLSRGVAGFVEDKRWAMFLGLRNSGKGVLEALMSCAIESYKCAPTSQNFLVKSMIGEDSNKSNGWMLPLEFTRMAFVQELPKNTNVQGQPKYVMNGTLLKALASGGDTMTARLLRQDGREFKVGATLMFQTNHTLPMDTPDAFQTGFRIQSSMSFVPQSKLDEVDEKIARRREHEIGRKMTQLESIRFEDEKKPEKDRRTEEDLRKWEEAEDLRIEETMVNVGKMKNAYRLEDPSIKALCKTPEMGDAFLLILLDFFGPNAVTPNCHEIEEVEDKQEEVSMTVTACFQYTGNPSDTIRNQQLKHIRETYFHFDVKLNEFNSKLTAWGNGKVTDFKSGSIRGLRGLVFLEKEAKRMRLEEKVTKKKAEMDGSKKMAMLDAAMKIF